MSLPDMPSGAFAAKFEKSHCPSQKHATLAVCPQKAQIPGASDILTCTELQPQKQGSTLIGNVATTTIADLIYTTLLPFVD